MLFLPLSTPFVKGKISVDTNGYKPSQHNAFGTAVLLNVKVENEPNSLIFVADSPPPPFLIDL